MPYYEFREVLTVRAADAPRFRSLADLRGRRVATLGGTTAYELLLAAEREHGIQPVSYDDDVHPYDDLANGRVDAVLLDNVIAERSMRRMPGLVTQPDAVAVGHYVGILGPARNGAAGSDRRHPAAGDDRRPARNDSAPLARVERRSAEAARAPPRERARTRRPPRRRVRPGPCGR